MEKRKTVRKTGLICFATGIAHQIEFIIPQNLTRIIIKNDEACFSPLPHVKFNFMA